LSSSWPTVAARFAELELYRYLYREPAGSSGVYRLADCRYQGSFGHDNGSARF